MRKIFFGIISILVIAGLAWFFFWQKQLPATAPGEQVNETTEKAWVEVVNRGVYLVKEDGTLGTELKTGDEVEGGQTVMTDQTGLANLHFSDGSVARLETQTKIDLKDFEYFPGNKTLKVKIFLQSGRIWSRIKALMTTQSYWEVETSNAVAAVRGTSFGVVYFPGQTTIIGSVHLINVNAIDPQSQKIVENNTAYVGAEQYIKINDQDITGLLAGVKLTSKVRPYTQAIINDAWVIKSKSLDEDLSEQSPTSTVTRPKPDEELNTKFLKEQADSVSSTEQEQPVVSDEEVLQKRTADYVSGSSGSEQDSFDEPVQDEINEEDFYRSVDFPINEDTSVDSEITEPDSTGTAPLDLTNGFQNDTANDTQTPESATTTINPNLTTKSTSAPSALSPVTSTSILPTTNLRTTNLIR
jgi:hypothetical protein